MARILFILLHVVCHSMPNMASILSTRKMLISLTSFGQTIHLDFFFCFVDRYLSYFEIYFFCRLILGCFVFGFVQRLESVAHSRFIAENEHNGNYVGRSAEYALVKILLKCSKWQSVFVKRRRTKHFKTKSILFLFLLLL